MIRMAEKADIKQIAEIFKQLHNLHMEIRSNYFNKPNDNYYEVAIKNSICKSENNVFVADDDGIIKGYAITKIFDINDELHLSYRKCVIEQFAVHSDFYKNGIGTELIKFIKEYSADKRCNAVELNVWYENYAAIDFYALMDFNPKTIFMEIKL